jgi:hypothetical protein
MSTVDQRRKPRSDVVRSRAALDHIAAAWSIVESNFRSDGERTDVKKNRARAVAHLRDAIRAIEGGQR